MISEEDLENDVLTPEVIKPVVTTSKDLMLFIEEAELEPAKAQFLIAKYADHFAMAAEWAKKASKIIVTHESQTVLMEEAKVARLFLRKKRLEIENDRKLLKAGALKECQVIDRSATFLKDVIEPSEEHLMRQEKFVELRQKAEDERILAEAHAKMEQERIAKEEADRKALALAQAENERLRNEQKKIEAENARKIEEERKARQAELDRVQKENEAKLAIEREKQEAQLAKERAEREKVESELRAKKQAEMKAEADKIRAEEKLKSAGDEEKLIKLRNDLIIFISNLPKLKSTKHIRLMADIESNLNLCRMMIKITEEE